MIYLKIIILSIAIYMSLWYITALIEVIIKTITERKCKKDMTFGIIILSISWAAFYYLVTVG